jgi:hypothetical protein
VPDHLVYSLASPTKAPTHSAESGAIPLARGAGRIGPRLVAETSATPHIFFMPELQKLGRTAARAGLGLDDSRPNQYRNQEYCEPFHRRGSGMRFCASECGLRLMEGITFVGQMILATGQALSLPAQIPKAAHARRLLRIAGSATGSRNLVHERTCCQMRRKVVRNH